uniref:Citrate transporter-like domain-containing protein n=1 Tax=Branchiostoma floridae TaxID=7739 RepID=C3YB30_BRAFL|eukprot:XP_002606482.1 hypothetical protein BRAFLDRAFT_91937 [Branchiostoma floridae]
MTAVSQNDSGNETQSTKIHKTLQRQVSSSETVENVSLNPSDVQRLEFQSEDSQKQETSQDNSAFKVFDNPQTDQDVHPVPTLQITDGVPTLTTENEANVDTNVMLSSCELLIRPRHRRPKPGRLAKASRIYRAELQAYLDKQQQKEEEKQQQQQRWQRYGGYRFTKSRLSQPGEKSGEAKPKKASLHEVKMLHENKSGGLEIPTVKQQTSSLSSDSKRLQDDSTFVSKSLSSTDLLCMDGVLHACAYVIIIMAAYWMFEVVPLAVTALLPMILFPVMGIQPSSEVCLNYLKDNSVLLLGGLLVAIAVEKCNLHTRIALRILLLVGSELQWVMFGFMAATGLLSMWISNTAAAAMMTPIGQAVLDQLFSEERRRQQEESDDECSPLIITDEDIENNHHIVPSSTLENGHHPVMTDYESIADIAVQ